MYSIYGYSNLIKQITEIQKQNLQNQRQRATNIVSDIIETKNRIRNITSPISDIIKRENQIQNMINPVSTVTECQNRIKASLNTMQNFTDFYSIVSEILLSANISKFNNQLQYFYDNIPEDIENNVDDDTINVAENIYNAIEEFNANPNTTEKVKVPFCKTPAAENLKYFLTLLATIVSILYYSGYNVKEDFIEPVTTFTKNSKITDITNE